VRYLIEHETRLAFPEPVREHQVELRLVPREAETQRLLSWRIETEPGGPLASHVDCFGNTVQRLSLVTPHDHLAARVEAEVETLLDNPFDYTPLRPAEERAWLARRLRDEPRLNVYLLHRSPSVPELGPGMLDLDWPRADPGCTILENVQAAMAWAEESFDYVPGATEVHAALADFVEQRAGVCQDFAHLLVALVRSWGVPARYVAGYVEPDSDALQAATHAWAEVLIPGAGWRGFDATRRLLADWSYVPLAAGRDSRDAAPLRGSFKGDDAGEPPEVRVRVARQTQAQ
jgi:transglutaminase-like putative cysteine protease